MMLSLLETFLGIDDLKSFRFDLKLFLEWYTGLTLALFQKMNPQLKAEVVVAQFDQFLFVLPHVEASCRPLCCRHGSCRRSSCHLAVKLSSVMVGGLVAQQQAVHHRWVGRCVGKLWGMRTS